MRLVAKIEPDRADPPARRARRDGDARRRPRGAHADAQRVVTVSDAVLLRFPFTGRWMALNSPADHVPSHGSDLLGTTYAIDFVAVDEESRTGPRDLRTFFTTESPERFLAFGRPILSPIAGTIVAAHDGEPDHEARRSLFTAVPYLLTQRRRMVEGVAGIAGNHVIVAIEDDGPFVLLAHLRRGTVRPRVGDRVEAGTQVGECGNSGNSTQPHVHVQATDSIAWDSARGLPIAFLDSGHEGAGWIPRNRQPFDVGAGRP